jgi:hypothetical protein
MHNRIMSAGKRVKFGSDRMSYIILRGVWCNIILNVHTKQKMKLRYERQIV